MIAIWNTQGRAPYVMFSNGQRTLAHPAHAHIKLGTWWLLAKEAYGPANNAEVTSASGYDQLWLGSVMEDQQDASGLLYRRNRYYDPATGRFTQEDPIGLAGGLNVYGFAAGDPVTYNDPYGLCPTLTLSGWVPCPPYSYAGTVRLTRGRISSGEGRYGVRNPWVGAYSFLNYSRLRDWGEQQGFAQARANPSRSASNVANAARHQRWQCEITRKFGAEEAAAAGNAHEEGSTFVNDSQADQNNNAIGRAVGRTSRHETGTCEQAVARNMDSGHFYQPTEEGVEYAGPAN